MDRYTTLAAQEMAARGERIGLSRLLFSPFWAFFKTYFLKRGFQDGFEGLVIAHMAAIYVFAKYIKATIMGSRRCESFTSIPELRCEVARFSC
jgi:hypothetical protein